MHMADALLSPAVGAVMWCVSAGAVAYSAAKIRKEDSSEKKLPMMAVAGAFVFTAQMINFTIPGTGSSGHIGGGILLAGLLGGFPALIVIASVLLIQCLLFADGGLLALGCNIFNMGVIPCLIMYPLLFRPILKKEITKKRIILASVLSAVIGLQMGAFSVVCQTAASGITVLPFKTFLLMMQPIHLAIGFVEGIVTSGILYFVHSARPEIMLSVMDRNDGNISYKTVAAVLAAASVILGGAVSYMASSHPDGLEWSIEKIAGTAELEAKGDVFEASQSIIDKTAVFPDYGFADSENSAGNGVSGVIGGAATCLLIAAAGFTVSKLKKKKV